MAKLFIPLKFPRSLPGPVSSGVPRRRSALFLDLTRILMAHSESYCSISEIPISPKSVRMLNRAAGLVNSVNYTCQSELAVTAIRIPARDAAGMQIIDEEPSADQAWRPSMCFSCLCAPRTAQNAGRGCPAKRAPPGQRDSTVYTTNMATPAANIATVVTATTAHPKRELGWPCISFLSEATTRIATRRKGANNPLITAVQ